jgi:hypothetical protein
MQRASTKLRVDADQLSLLPELKNRPIVSQPVNLAHIPLLTDTKKALEYACMLANIVPKAICPHMEVDKTVWSRICSGEFDLDGRDIPKFCRVVNNDAYFLFLGHELGYDPASFRKRLDDKDREIQELKQRLADSERTTQQAIAAAATMLARAAK